MFFNRVGFKTQPIKSDLFIEIDINHTPIR